MKNRYLHYLYLMTIVLLFSGQIRAQNKLTINDRAQFLDTSIESALSDRLSSDSVSLTSLIDNKKRCDYWFATLVRDKSDLLLSVTDCNDKVAGTKNLGTMVFSANDTEKATLLYFAISEIIRNPYDADNNTEPESDSSAMSVDRISDPGHHSSRYFFSPSALNIRKGEIYYNTLYFVIHDVQYGLTDEFSVGMGTTIFGFPFYLTPKVSIPVDSRNSFAIGDMLMIGTWGTRFTGNLLYGTYTRGGALQNFTVGGGYLFLGGGDVADKIHAPVINFSGLVKMSARMFFITENFTSAFTLRNTANYNNYNPVTGEYSWYSEDFDRNVFFIYGSTGFRFINKVKDLRSWQFGLSYFYSAYEEVPGKYSGSNWWVERQDQKKLVAFPVIGYARKFSIK